MKWLLNLLFKLFYRLRVYNSSAIEIGVPAIIVANHISVIDWLLLYAILPSDWKFVVARQLREPRWIRSFLEKKNRTIEIDTISTYGAKALAEFLRKGGRVVIFPEARISPTGTIQKFYEGIGFLLHTTKAYLVPCYIRGLYRSIWSCAPGRKKIFVSASIHFGEPLRPPDFNMNKGQEREKLTEWAREKLVNFQLKVELELGPRHLIQAIAECVRRAPHAPALSDITFKRFTFLQLIVAAELLSQGLSRRLEGAGNRIGILLPTSNAAVITILSLWRLNLVPTILNFTMGERLMQKCISIAGVRHIITSKTFIEKSQIDIEEIKQAGVNFIHLEDIKKELPLYKRILTYLLFWTRPYLIWNRTARLINQVYEDDPSSQVAAIVFTSGSEGDPKGVELTHGNIIANIQQMLCTIDVCDDDRMFNALPIFHSFGLTVGVCTGLVRGIYSFQYPSPLHYRIIPTIFYEEKCTIFLSTNTFLKGYAKKAHPGDFHTVRYIFAGAEKLQPQTAMLWFEKFGVRVFEGYGVTECAPVVSVNTPLAYRLGSVGRLLPGIEYKIMPVEGIRQGGRLLLRGPNVMRGYINPNSTNPNPTTDGWYDTGDIAWVDDAGYLHIEGRLRRFAKIAGEMVSLTAVEEAIRNIVEEPDQEVSNFVIISIQGDDKGEMLVLVCEGCDIDLNWLREEFLRHKFPMIWLPSLVVKLKELPRLATGKPAYPEIIAMVKDQLKLSSK